MAEKRKSIERGLLEQIIEDLQAGKKYTINSLGKTLGQPDLRHASPADIVEWMVKTAKAQLEIKNANR